MTRQNLLDLGAGELDEFCRERGWPLYRARQIRSWVYEKRVFDFERMSNLPAPLRAELSARYPIELPGVVRVQGSCDTTRKYLLRLRDGQMVETVLIPASPALYGEPSDRQTLCVSSQVGCAYGCRFCASGLDGWKRNLTPGEILSQVLLVESREGVRVSNVVFMGMGEPFANYENVMAAIGTMNAREGIGLGARHITVSTSGLVDGIRKFAAQPLQLRLAISLHGATDEVRDRIMPINRRYPVARLIEACREYTRQKSQRLTFEYILIAGLNDSAEQAAVLARLAASLGALVNLIPYNSVEGLEWTRPDPGKQEVFWRSLTRAGVKATLRREKGHDISAACGQLRLQAARCTGPVP